MPPPRLGRLGFLLYLINRNKVLAGGNLVAREEPNMAKKKTPVTEGALTGNSITGADEASNFGDRIARYGTARTRAVSMLEHLRTLDDKPAKAAAAGLSTCGDYLHFREYFTVEKVRLHAARFCKQHLICPLCAIRRGSKSLQAYLDKWAVVREENPGLKLYLVTLTVKNGPDLRERQTHLTASLRRLMDRRRYYNAGIRGAPYSSLVRALGAVYSLELTNKGNGWHPHCHMIVAGTQSIDQSELSREWHQITGDSMVVDVRPITGDPVDGFMEVFKYAVKFSDLTLSDNWEAAQVLKGKRLLNSFGLFRGVQVPDSLLDEPLDDLPYWDRFYRFVGREYHLTGESPH